MLHPDAGWDVPDLNVFILDGPPPAEFDCGGDEQNRFLYERAWRDQGAGLTVTYLFYLKGMFVGYVTVMADAIPLCKKERGKGVYYQTVSAVKLAQLGVDREFQGRGLGEHLVGFVIQLARTIGHTVGCRYVTVDSNTERVGWYERQGFVRNQLWQQKRREDAEENNRDPDRLAISLRFDLREPPPASA